MKAGKGPERTELLNLGGRCNQRCVFCGAAGLIRPHSPRAAAAAIRRAGEHLTISGWEPTLHPGLAGTVEKARRAGVKNVTLFTNGLKLADPAYARRLADAGVTTFHINFPAHTPAMDERLTGVKGAFALRAAGVRNALAAQSRKFVSLVCVVNSLNYRSLPGYAAYVAENFPGLVHVLFTLPCVMGRARRDRTLVPRLSRVRPYLARACALLLRRRVKCLVENAPLCLMPGFEYASYDARQALASGRLDAPAKFYRPACAGCRLKSLCPGLREDYLHIYGDGELKPPRLAPEAAAEKIRLLAAAGL
jgi:MoaA/NifB/PqqE/SkfB family radical SAM enzyme